MCVRVDSVVMASGRISQVGGPCGWTEDNRWLLPVDDVVGLIKDPHQQWDFFVEEPAGDRVGVVVREGANGPYLTTVPDTAPNAQNNLANLPRPGDLTISPRAPYNLAWFPGAVRPVLKQFGAFKGKPNPSGIFYPLPTPSVGFKLLAPWPGALHFVVRHLFQGALILETELPKRGIQPPWVDVTPVDADFVKRDQTLWGGQIALPPPATGTYTYGETYEIDVIHESYNPWCLSPRRSDPLKMELRGIGPGPSVVVTGGNASAPPTGVARVTFANPQPGQQDYPTRFWADSTLLSGVPAGAVITSVTNTSQTAPLLSRSGASRRRQPLGGMLFGLTDASGQTRSMIPGGPATSLGAGQSTGMFNGMEARGQWRAEYVGGSVSFLFEQPGTGGASLNPAISLNVAWAKP